MTSEALNPADELKRLIAQGGLSEDALLAITGIPPESLWFLLDEAKPGMMRATAETHALAGHEFASLSLLAGQLTEGMAVGDDERLKAIFESLTIECHLTPENIARLTGVDGRHVERVLRDPQSVPTEKKYELAVKGSYLLNAVNTARGH